MESSYSRQCFTGLNVGQSTRRAYSELMHWTSGVSEKSLAFVGMILPEMPTFVSGVNWIGDKSKDRKFRNLTCLVFLQFCPVSKCGTRQNCSVSNILKTTENCLDLSPIQFTPQTWTRQDVTPCRRCELGTMVFCHRNAKSYLFWTFERLTVTLRVKTVNSGWQS